MRLGKGFCPVCKEHETELRDEDVEAIVGKWQIGCVGLEPTGRPSGADFPSKIEHWLADVCGCDNDRGGKRGGKSSCHHSCPRRGLQQLGTGSPRESAGDIGCVRLEDQRDEVLLVKFRDPRPELGLRRNFGTIIPAQSARPKNSSWTAIAFSKGSPK